MQCLTLSQLLHLSAHFASAAFRHQPYQHHPFFTATLTHKQQSSTPAQLNIRRSVAQHTDRRSK
jgi:hypothetical protein